jgi:hypothetical protein
MNTPGSTGVVGPSSRLEARITPQRPLLRLAAAVAPQQTWLQYNQGPANADGRQDVCLNHTTTSVASAQHVVLCCFSHALQGKATTYGRQVVRSSQQKLLG